MRNGAFQERLRAFLLLGQIEQTLTKQRWEHAHLETIQAMKCLQQFCLDGHWSTAWKLTTLLEPFAKPRTAAAEVELEAAIAELKIEEDLRRRSKNIVQGGADYEKDDGDTPPAVTPKRKAQAKTKSG